MPIDPSTVLRDVAIAAVFLLAGGVKGVVGLGLPTVSMALLALFMQPAEAAALLIVPSLATNAWQMRPWSSLAPLLRRLWPLQVGVCAGTLLAAWTIGLAPGRWAGQALGVALVAYGAWGLRGLSFRIGARTQRWAAPLAGALTGIVTAVSGVFVVPAVPYLQSIGLTRDELIQAMGLSFTVSTLALAAVLATDGRVAAGAAGASLALLVPALLGMAGGAWLRERLSQQLFRRCFFGSLVLLGGYMAVAG